MKLYTSLSTVLLLLLCACGGGGGSAPSSSNTVTTPPPPPLSIYVGIWQNACQFHAQDTAEITMPSVANGNLEIALRTDYYDGTGCTGTIRGTSTLTSKLTLAYAKTIDTFVALTSSGGSSSLRVDQITASAPALTTAIVGPGVQHLIKNGQAQWCMSFSNGDSTCVNDDGPQAASTSQGALYMRNNELYLLSPSTGGYSADEIFTKK